MRLNIINNYFNWNEFNKQFISPKIMISLKDKMQKNIISLLNLDKK